MFSPSGTSASGIPTFLRPAAVVLGVLLVGHFVVAVRTRNAPPLEARARSLAPAQLDWTIPDAKPSRAQLQLLVSHDRSFAERKVVEIPKRYVVTEWVDQQFPYAGRLRDTPLVRFTPSREQQGHAFDVRLTPEGAVEILGADSGWALRIPVARRVLVHDLGVDTSGDDLAYRFSWKWVPANGAGEALGVGTGGPADPLAGSHEGTATFARRDGRWTIRTVKLDDSAALLK